jgi:hypothetical protein
MLHAKRLKKTGDGINDPNNDMGPAFYIEGEGPDDYTPSHAVNIWGTHFKSFCFYLTSNPT